MRGEGVLHPGGVNPGCAQGLWSPWSCTCMLATLCCWVWAFAALCADVGVATEVVGTLVPPWAIEQPTFVYSTR